MSDSHQKEFEFTLFNQLIGTSILLAVFFGLAHNVFLSEGNALTGPLPSTHPLTALGFAILAFAMFFQPQWERFSRLRTAVCLSMIVLSGLRIAEAVFPEHMSVFSQSGISALLESAGLYGRFSVETALFLTCCFCFELSGERHHVVRLLLLSICFAILSLGFAQVIYSLFLWGHELSLITQVAMWLVCMNLLVRMRRQQPFNSIVRTGRSAFFLQFTALALYLLPMVLGAVALNMMRVTSAERVPFEIVFAGTSCVMLVIVLAVGSYFDRESQHTGLHTSFGSAGDGSSQAGNADKRL